MVVFAEQLGRIVGTVQAKAEGWLDRDALNAQISTVRDSAAELLNQLGGAAALRQISRGPKGQDAGTTTSGAKGKGAARSKVSAKGKVVSKAKASATSGAATTTGGSKARSGGAVDAPGKKHRKPTPSESGATGNPRGEGARIAKLKTATRNRIQQRRG
jgi:hypothetical protein